MNKLQKYKKILYLGPSGSYTELAMNFFKETLNLNNIESEAVSTIRKTITFADLSDDVLCVVPVENSIEGIVRETVDALLLSDRAKIMAQTVLPISHCLISKGELNDIKTIISHPQALNQCQGFITSNFGREINLISANSTSYATKSLLNLDKTNASIGNKMCAKMYGLNIIKEGINDIKDNKTRFILIGNSRLDTKDNRTSIAYSTKNEPGALLSVLEIFKMYGLNLIYLESRPSKEKAGEYVFFTDIDKGLDEIKDAVDNVCGVCNFCKILGSYKNFEYNIEL